jgi:hypothetical protein
VELKQKADGTEYLEKVIARQTKARQGHDPRNTRESTLKACSRSDNRCPVSVYKKFRDNRPADMCKKDDPFYLGTMVDPKPDQPWFHRQRLGPDKLGHLMKVMATVAQLDRTKRQLTNSSLRKYLVQTLSDQNVPLTLIQQVTGHASLASINNYSSINEKQQQRISNALIGSNDTGFRQQQQLTAPRPNDNDTGFRQQTQLTAPAPNDTDPGFRQSQAPGSNDTGCIGFRQHQQHNSASHSYPNPSLPRPSVTRVSQMSTTEQEQPIFNLFAGATISGGTFKFFMNGHPPPPHRLE